MITINFNISDFNISGEDIPEVVADKILKYHIIPMQSVRNNLNIPIYPSLKSGYRSPKWEVSRKRNGQSQHCFLGLGAVDWTCADFKKNKEALLASIIIDTNYTRIAVYDGFIHCDYKGVTHGKREVYTSDAKSNWKFLRYV